MEHIEGFPNFIIIKKGVVVNLAEYGIVLGFSIETLDDSSSDAKFQYNGTAMVKLKAGDPARTIGGFYGAVPVSYNGRIKITFDNPSASNNQVLLIITTVKCK